MNDVLLLGTYYPLPLPSSIHCPSSYQSFKKLSASIGPDPGVGLEDSWMALVRVGVVPHPISQQSRKTEVAELIT